MSSSAASSFAFAAVSPAPTLVGSPRAVPSVTSVPASASPHVRRLQYAVGVMSRKFPPSLRFVRQAPVPAAGLAFLPARFGRPLSLGCAVGGGLGERSSTVARRGRRIASADSSPTASACCLGSFVTRPRHVTVSGALSPVPPLRGPTRRSRGRCAIKPRSAPELSRWPATGLTI